MVSVESASSDHFLLQTQAFNPDLSFWACGEAEKNGTAIRSGCRLD
jgi:hypothetical protein